MGKLAAIIHSLSIYYKNSNVLVGREQFCKMRVELTPPVLKG